ncbi:MAG TPA: hypothetical protein VH500_21575 [Nitrososphaeraceae archaeon]|jgi:deferrochelatase/peroxidase EfeB
MSLQNGIYYNESSAPPGNFGIVFLDVKKGTTASSLGASINELWKMCQNLEKGITNDFSPGSLIRRYTGELSVLIGYGSKIFSIQNIRKRCPADFSGEYLFRRPTKEGDPIIEGSGLKFTNVENTDDCYFDEIMIQFTSMTSFTTNRAILETCKMLQSSENNNSNFSLQIRKFYTGFNQPDQRNWLGFYDGISNMKSDERIHAIAINGNSLSQDDSWLMNGTYMAFLRIGIDLGIWSSIDQKTQEIIIGRDKLTGCPLVGIDEAGNPVKDPRCPVRGTLDITDSGNEGFREHGEFGQQTNLPSGVSDKGLVDSHIGRTHRAVGVPAWNSESSRIFRQSFEFLDPIDGPPRYVAGLNFVCFLNTPKRLFSMLRNWMGAANFGGDPDRSVPEMQQFLKIYGAGIFTIPPINKDEPFPGASLFPELELVSNNETSVNGIQNSQSTHYPQ